MNRIVLFLCIAILGGCVSIDSVANRNLHKKFSNPLIVIPFEYRTRKIARNLKDELEEVFADNKMNVKVLTLQTEASKLELNSSSKDQETLNDEVYKNSRDLVIFFKPNEIYYVNGGMQTATYILIATDVSTGKEVWKANYKAQGGFGPASLARKSAKLIFQKLKADHIL